MAGARLSERVRKLSTGVDLSAAHAKVPREHWSHLPRSNDLLTGSIRRLRSLSLAMPWPLCHCVHLRMSTWLVTAKAPSAALRCRSLARLLRFLPSPATDHTARDPPTAVELHEPLGGQRRPRAPLAGTDQRGHRFVSCVVPNIPATLDNRHDDARIVIRRL